MDMNLSKLWVVVEDTEAWWAAAHGVAKRHDWRTEQQIFYKKHQKAARRTIIIDKQWGPNVYHRELYSVSCEKL